jgi:hypothetical protein
MVATTASVRAARATTIASGPEATGQRVQRQRREAPTAVSLCASSLCSRRTRGSAIRSGGGRLERFRVTGLTPRHRVRRDLFPTPVTRLRTHTLFTANTRSAATIGPR